MYNLLRRNLRRHNLVLSTLSRSPLSDLPAQPRTSSQMLVHHVESHHTTHLESSLIRYVDSRLRDKNIRLCRPFLSQRSRRRKRSHESRCHLLCPAARRHRARTVQYTSAIHSLQALLVLRLHRLPLIHRRPAQLSARIRGLDLVWATHFVPTKPRELHRASRRELTTSTAIS